MSSTAIASLSSVCCHWNGQNVRLEALELVMPPGLPWSSQRGDTWVWFLFSVFPAEWGVCPTRAEMVSALHSLHVWSLAGTFASYIPAYSPMASLSFLADGWFLACLQTPPRLSVGQPVYMSLWLLIWTQSCQTLFGPRGQNLVWPETCWKVSWPGHPPAILLGVTTF